MITKYIFTLFIVVTLSFAIWLHADEDEENPHTEMVDDQFVCLECHTDLPKEGETSPTYFLVDDPSENCLGCHDEVQHAGAKEHLGQKADPLPADENGEISCFTCHDPHPQGVIEGRTVYNAELNETNRKFIRVVVAPGVKERLDRDVETEEVSEVYLREPVGKICVSCHDTDKKPSWRKFATWEKFTNLFSY